MSLVHWRKLYAPELWGSVDGQVVEVQRTVFEDILSRVRVEEFG